MNKPFTSILVALAFMAMLPGCKKDTNNTNTGNNGPCTDGSANYPFLANGHREAYYMTDLFGDVDTQTVIYGAEANGKYPVYVSFAQNILGTGNYTSYNWACGEDFYEDTTPSSKINYYFSLNANVGSTWVIAYPGDTSYYQLLSKNATVTTINLGQTFTNCYEFTWYGEGDINVDTIYFTPSEGQVYYNGLLLNEELISKNF